MNWLKSLFGRERREQEFDRELQFHIEAVSREYEAKGLTLVEAHRRAMLEFGGKEQTTQELRDRKSTRLNSSHSGESRMPSSA